MKKLDPTQFRTPIPKNSKFALNDWILKSYGRNEGLIAKVVGYQMNYGPGNYLIQFENGALMKTKQKYFRGPYKSKEIALKFQDNPFLKETPEDLRLKENEGNEMKILPKTERLIKETLTKAPYNFTWLDTPVSFVNESSNELITVLAIRKDPYFEILSTSYISRRYDFHKNGFEDCFCVFRTNDPMTKRLKTSQGSAYHYLRPNVKTGFQIVEKSGTFNPKDTIDGLVSNIFYLYNQPFIQKTDNDIISSFQSYNRLISSEQINETDIIEICGGLVERDGKKILIREIDLETLKIKDRSIIKNYHIEASFEFNSDTDTTLDNLPLSVQSLHIASPSLMDLNNKNHIKTNLLILKYAPKLKNLQGLETFKELERISIIPNALKKFESFEGCPSNISLIISDNQIKTLKGLPSNLDQVSVSVELNSFDCPNTTIEQLNVNKKPKSLKGLPKGEIGYITGYSNKEIEEEKKFGPVREKLPELEGIF
jgi:hypothetical protein